MKDNFIFQMSFRHGKMFQIIVALRINDVWVHLFNTESTFIWTLSAFRLTNELILSICAHPPPRSLILSETLIFLGNSAKLQFQTSQVRNNIDFDLEWKGKSGHCLVWGRQMNPDKNPPRALIIVKTQDYKSAPWEICEASGIAERNKWGFHNSQQDGRSPFWAVSSHERHMSVCHTAGFYAIIHHTGHLPPGAGQLQPCPHPFRTSFPLPLVLHLMLGPFWTSTSAEVCRIIYNRLLCTDQWNRLFIYGNCDVGTL